MATSSIGPGDELRYWYSVMQAHRDLVHPPTPTPKTKTAMSAKRQAGQGNTEAVKRQAVTDAEAVKRQAVTDAEAVKRQAAQGTPTPKTKAVKRCIAVAANLTVQPPTPTSKAKAVKPATATTNTSADVLDPDCLCDGFQKCKQGFCWFLGGRVLLSARRVHGSSR